MGIRGYTRWLKQSFGQCFAPCPRTGLVLDRNPRSHGVGFDHVHFDLAARL